MGKRHGSDRQAVALPDRGCVVRNPQCVIRDGCCGGEDKNEQHVHRLHSNR